MAKGTDKDFSMNFKDIPVVRYRPSWYENSRRRRVTTPYMKLWSKIMDCYEKGYVVDYEEYFVDNTLYCRGSISRG